MPRAAIVAGTRTPFAKSGTTLKHLKAIDLGIIAVRELVARAGVRADDVDHLIYGTVVHDPHAGNIAREVGLATLPRSVPAVTVSRACASANQAISDGVNLIERGYADVVIAGGAESLSHIPIMLKQSFSEKLVKVSRGKTAGAKLSTLASIRPGDFVPDFPQIAERSTGESMGQAAERMAKENHISREDQDAWAFRSHQFAAAGMLDGRMKEEIAPLYLPPKYKKVMEADNGVRPDTTLEKMASLRPVFDRKHGSVTAATSSPLTDGASAVMLMSEDKARAEGFEVLAYVRSYAYSGIDPKGQLLQGPAYAAPIALDRAGITMKEIGLMEMHEAFAAQVLSNLQGLASKKFAQDELGRSEAVGHPDIDIINVMGGSISIGHPFGATGGRVTMTLAREMRRRDVQFGLITVCAAGGLGFAMVLERE